MNIELPKDVTFILNQLEKSGYKAYVVGGCVRDSIMHKEPHDWDITTNATPDQVKECFNNERIIDTGLKHGTVTLNKNGCYEITTFRTESGYTDNRHPDNVDFVNDIVLDLARRDLTQNAIAYNPNEGIIDPFNGEKDIENKIIRCVGEPGKRFQEDALRILRTLRFAAKTGFQIETNTALAIHNNRNLLCNVSQERITSEFIQIIMNADKKLLLEYCDVLAEIIPEVKPCIGFEQHNPHHKYDVYEHLMQTVENVCKKGLYTQVKEFTDEDKRYLKVAAFFHDISKPDCYKKDDNEIGHFYGHVQKSEEKTEEILRRMKFDNQTIKYVIQIIREHEGNFVVDPVCARKLVGEVGIEQAIRIFELRKADVSAQSEYLISEKMKNIYSYDNIINTITEDKQCCSVKDLAVNGKDLMLIGYKNGEDVGNQLRYLLKSVIKNPELNTKEQLIDISVKRKMRKQEKEER